MDDIDPDLQDAVLGIITREIVMDVVDETALEQTVRYTNAWIGQTVDALYEPGARDQVLTAYTAYLFLLTSK